ncbi:hypothetical protein DMH25_16590 [Streptomyces sp. WAC 01325]|uniref:hypothetical protein n=1 Tax=Streptomyces TaxID=1883 RepID=UPI000F86BD80|nr:hypothetical protein [Streptomyces sp. WAC 01325]RSN08102.1 hypothetical protein DMH25_16590 [Streptomyces sp. WAC 01325]WCH93700.1 hypothetical protein POD33_16855 [Streptomyces moderatus]
MPASENTAQQRPEVTAGVSMRDLLAAGAAARLISTPPREPEAGRQQHGRPEHPPRTHREAA